MTDVRPNRYAVIPTHNRSQQLQSLVAQLGKSCDYIVIIDNASDPPVHVQMESWGRELEYNFIHVMRDEEQPPNLPRFWNDALRWISEMEKDNSAWDVAILNDDADLPQGWYDYVANALRSHDVLAASADAYGHVKSPLIRRGPDNNLMTRMCPWAFMIRGECGVEADEKLRWWWQDTDIEWRMAIAGGVVVMPGYIVRNTGANSTTFGALAEQAAADRRTFAEKWGYNPW